MTMSTVRRGALAGTLLCLALAAGPAAHWWSHRGLAAGGPPTTADPVAGFARESTIVLPFIASLDAVQGEMNRKVPTRLYTVDENKDACVAAKQVKFCPLPRIFHKGCAVREASVTVTPQIDCHVEGSVDRGPISVGGTGPVATLAMPVSASVTVRGRGEIGKHIQKTADGSVAVGAKVRADLGEDWRPVAVVDADYNWTDRIGIDVLGLRITFAGKVDPKLKGLIDDFKAKLPELLARLEVREGAARAWGRGFATIHVGGEPDVWLRFAPSAAGFGGFAIQGRTLTALVMAAGTVETFVGAKPPERPATPLPPLRHGLPSPSFEFYVPVQADYDALAATTRHALKVGEEQVFDVPRFGTVKVVFDDVRLHQTTGGKLAVGVELHARAPSDVLATRGVVWAVADVDIDNAAKRIKVGDLSIRVDADNAVVGLLASVLRLAPVTRAIQKAVGYDFSKDYDGALRRGGQALNGPVSDGLRLQGRIIELGAEKVLAGPRGLVTALVAKGSLELHYDVAAR